MMLLRAARVAFTFVMMNYAAVAGLFCAAARPRGVEIAMERLVFGYGTSRHEGETPDDFALEGGRRIGETALPAPRIRRGRLVLPRILGGFRLQAEGPHDAEPRDWAFIGLMVFTALLFFRPQDHLPAAAGRCTLPSCRALGRARLRWSSAAWAAA